jgi:hypothetical protein
MLLIDEIIEEEIDARLKQITVADGFLNDASIIDGFLIHYINDLLNKKKNVSFPCIAYHPVTDNVKNGSTGKLGKVTRSMNLVGCVDASKNKGISKKLNSLIFDVRKALAFDKYDNKFKATNIELGTATFSPSESGAQFAMFETILTIEYIETRE